MANENRLYKSLMEMNVIFRSLSVANLILKNEKGIGKKSISLMIGFYDYSLSEENGNQQRQNCFLAQNCFPQHNFYQV